MQRNSSFFLTPLALLLALGPLAACSSAGGGGVNPEADAGEVDGGEAVDEPDAGSDSADGDAPCVPKGCDEQGFECGMAEDGCGNPLDCTGVKQCEGYEVCGSDNRCGCTPKSCDELTEEAGRQACGTLENGCGEPVDCGGCDGLTGERWTCSAGYCECPAATTEAACAARECGSASDGCGETVDCGACASPAQECSGEGACECKSSDAYAATACAGKTCGSVTVDGCTYDCGPACSQTCGPTDNCKTVSCDCAGASECSGAGTCCTPSNQAALCAVADCGSVVTDPCTGTTYTCGCEAGTTCVDKLYLAGSTRNTCVPSARAQLLGGYVVRAHSFQDFVLGLQRAETVSRVRVVQQSNGTLRLEDTGCVATTLSEGSFLPTRSVAQAYFDVPPLAATFSGDATTFARTAAHPEPAGFSPGLPTFCDGVSTTPTNANAPDFSAYANALDTSVATPSSGAKKAWIAAPGTCTCPVQSAVCAGDANKACLPAKVIDSTGSRDCRVHDVDSDGKPGFTVITSAGAVAGAVSAGKTEWTNGRVSAYGYHVAEAPADPNFAQAFTYCTGGTCSLLRNDAPAVPCRGEFNLVQFARISVAEDRVFGCQTFYNAPLATVANATTWSAVETVVKQSAVEAYFNGQHAPLQPCGAGSSCPSGMVCNAAAGGCYPKTSSGACTRNADCGTGWRCVTNSPVAPGACWPADIDTCKAPPT